MKTLRLTIALEARLSIATLQNTFGDYVMYKTQNHRYLQFTFSEVRMLSALHLKPVNALLQTFELDNPLHFKMLHMQDDDYNVSPTRIVYWDGLWTLEHSLKDTVIAKGRTIFDLF